MLTEEELLTAMRDMAKDAGEVFAHLRAAEDGLKRALARIPDNEVMEIDPATELGMKVDGIRLVLRRAVLPVASACGSLATDFGIAAAPEAGDQRAEVRGQRSEVDAVAEGGDDRQVLIKAGLAEFLAPEPPTCQVCGAPMLRFLRGPT